MYIFFILSVISALCCAVYGQQGPCQTASGGEGECKSVYKCQPLLAIVNKRDRTPQDTEILKKSHCGFDEKDPAVCCPAGNEPLTPSNRCFTPEGKPGQCISIYDCPAISNLLKPPVPQIQYVQRTRCNGPDKYSVCCGPVPDLDKQPQRVDCRQRVSAFPPDPESFCCGVDTNSGNKIYGGHETSVLQYPWMALIEYIDQRNTILTLCGGSLISGKYVLTAAHCVTGKVIKRGRPKNIRLGEYDTAHDGPDCMPVDPSGEDCTEGTTVVPIERTIPHPQYNHLNPLMRNDIALIRMTEMVPFTAFIRPVCLPTVDLTQGTDSLNTTAAGWGAVSKDKLNSDKKQDVVLPFVRKNVCQEAYSFPGRNVPLWKGQFCAGGEKGKDTCKGDSGGPLMYENGKIHEVIGVVSFGTLTCGLEDIPGVYTNVFEYITWIRNTIIP